MISTPMYQSLVKMFSDVLLSYAIVIDEATVNAQYCTICGKTFEKKTKNCEMIAIVGIYLLCVKVCL